MKVKKAVIPAAGLGTRFLPATKALPKEMLPIVDKPAIQYIIEEAIESGIESIIVVTGRNKRAIEDHFDKSIELENALAQSGKEDMLKMVEGISKMADIHYIRQKEPKGLGHAVLCARHFIGEEPFAVLLGDDIMIAEKPALRQMIDMYETFDTEIVGVQPVPLPDVRKYGIVSPQQDVSWKGMEAHWVQDLVEKPSPEEAPSQLAVMGRYILSPSIFPILERIKPGKGAEIQLTDALKEACQDHPLLALPLKGKRYDVGDKFGYIQATIELAIARPELRSNILSYMEALLAAEKQAR
ncbi:UTP--glucose-1-phosphate uridylyltransferase GalU [Aneurinibacillus sp. Ricciae_BoGa-3]|uniref:UTP--glucose-1-phosphate uridylyltransferase GalU n=1 Tax=Aneurinibacillus sp. Ricciae_BoGa-3 TaxID=3022697 RepID=UPI0023421B48|nr:UTP--glucose-1-phosphate uridylyltransferase GalU [Aneurinibacillus sp. Ricciae_BoGa-3]WCK55637.1 UTP--glucose-1-phosphate uridylyltransferase GalU [Aneurinibacillus sp. Ricciae_BoGa-3]